MLIGFEEWLKQFESSVCLLVLSLLVDDEVLQKNAQVQVQAHVNVFVIKNLLKHFLCIFLFKLN